MADELWGAAGGRIASQLVYPEARAALAAATRAGRLDQRALHRAINDLEHALTATQLIGVDQRLARAAGALAEEHALRGYDAVHLATVLAVNDAQLLVVTWDKDLAAAARNCGHPVAPAAEEPV